MISGQWPAPAKLNLFLHVIGRRADGYHDLQTVFQFLDLADELWFECNDEGVIERAGVDYGVSADEDLILRAAAALRDETGCRRGARIGIRKRLPLGGGLGGGSSDAATVLVALNRLWQTGLTAEDLARIGLSLGADVPVFVHGQAAWAEGVGERLAPVQPPEDWFLVLHPGTRVATGEVFNAPDLTRHTAPITIRDFLEGSGRNDCEAAVFRMYPDIAEARDWLAGRTGEARMTGTGACLFTRCADQQQALAIAREMPSRWQGFVARGRNRSPLLERLAREPA